MPTGEALQYSPPYWIPFLIALGMVLAFLGAIGTAVMKIVVQPLMHTLDQTNETLRDLATTNGRLTEKIAIVIDRGERRHDDPH